jgi:hypothetical protein
MSKVPKIAVCEWDDPEILAKEFCRIYALDESACAVLCQVILSNMRQNGIPVFGDDDNRDVTVDTQQGSTNVNEEEFGANVASEIEDVGAAARDHQDGRLVDEHDIIDLAYQPTSRSLSEHSGDFVSTAVDEDLLPHYDVMNWLLDGAAAARRRTVEEAQHQ